MFEGRVALSVQAKIGIVLPFNEPVSPFQAITAPRLNGQRLVEVVIVARLLIRLLDLSLNSFGRRKGPEDQRPKQLKLYKERSMVRIVVSIDVKLLVHTRCSGVMVVKLRPP